MKTYFLIAFLCCSFQVTQASLFRNSTRVAVDVQAVEVQASAPIIPAVNGVLLFSSEQIVERERARQALRRERFLLSRSILNGINESQSKEEKLIHLHEVKTQLSPVLTMKTEDQDIFSEINDAGKKRICCCFQYIKHSRLKRDINQLQASIEHRIYVECVDWNYHREEY